MKIAKNGCFCEELPIEDDFEAVLVNFCCYEYGANMLLRQFRRLAQENIWKYAN